MAEASVHRSTRRHRCDEAFLELLEEDFSISQFSLIQAFVGVPSVPKKQAIKVCEWAVRTARGDADRAGEMVRGWARRRKVGGYDPRLLDAPEMTFEQTARERAAFEGRA